jgi:hypothetical protein
MLKSTGPGLNKLAELLATAKGGKQKKRIAPRRDEVAEGEAPARKKKLFFGKEK